MFARLCRPRLLIALLCTSFATTLLGAGTAPSTAPTLVLFPFHEAEGLDPRYGSDYITKLGTTLTTAAEVKVVMGDAATAPGDYLHATKAADGDFYLTGFVAPPLNGQMAVIEQIVSARSGTVVWANTAHISNDQDIFDQAPIVQKALLMYATRGYFAILNPTPKPAPRPSATPKKNGITVPGGGGASGGVPQKPLDLPNEAYGFSSQPTAPPKVYASASHPSRFVVLTIGGNTVPPVIREYTISSLVQALQRHGQSVALGDPEQAQHRLPSPEVCAQTGGTYLVFGSVATKSADVTKGDDQWTDATLRVVAYNCKTQDFEQAGKPLAGSSSRWKAAIDHATNAAVTDYLLKMPTVARS